MQELSAISPLDGRYYHKTNQLRKYFSEAALIHYRINIELLYLEELTKIQHPKIPQLPLELRAVLHKLKEETTDSDLLEVKHIEKKLNHDVKAIEYFLRKKITEWGSHNRYDCTAIIELVHFGLTSQDINNTAIPLSLKYCLQEVYYPLLGSLLVDIQDIMEKFRFLPMLAHTHGQPATPTTLGKEFAVFYFRVTRELDILKKLPFPAKFGGATGSLNAHFIAFPDIDWHQFAQNFVENTLGLSRTYPTTQIEPYDGLAAIFDSLKRINNILIDFSRDCWQYISMNYLSQKILPGEVGSSAMPHKVNPIDFENAEGNLGFANAIFEFLSSKLPVSRLQRDLTDSTVLRNLGVPFGHTLVAFSSLKIGLSKIRPNQSVIQKDLSENWFVISEAIQTILRREGFQNPYELLKELTRTNDKPSYEQLHDFLSQLPVSESVKEELLQIKPDTYLGNASFF
ncbi:MAG: adenylosuccinate lyase [Bacteroidia bacterium]|nr:adenylosuccinate lyase [Bacteroidia bacterium]